MKWRSADGTVWDISKMKTSHIQNSISKIKREDWRLEYLPVLEKELKARSSKLAKALK